MAQRQFRSDDTSVWGEKYGNGRDGALSQNSATDSTPNTNCSGSSGATSLSVGSGSGFANGDLILIHQSQGTGVGTWELNKIVSGGGTTTLTLAYPLTINYGSGAQVYKLFQYSTAQLNVGQVLTGNGWDGTKGGIYALMACQSITIAGIINMNSTGYRGGSAGNNSNNYNTGATAGEGTTGQASSVNSSAANTNGGGSGAANLQGSSGGGNATTGGQVNGGSVVGNAELTVMVFGGGGAGLSRDTQGGIGTNGSGIVILIAPRIKVTDAISLSSATSTVATSGSSPSASPGTGAAGNLLCKGQVIDLGTNLVNVVAAAPGGGSNSGGQGGLGRIHADYSETVTGSAVGVTIDTRKDLTLANNSAAAMLV